MKIFTKLILLILVLGLAAPFFIKRPDGRPWMKVDDFMPNISGMKARAENWWSRMVGKVEDISGDKELDLPSGKTKVYRWRASDGSWQFSDMPPKGKSEEVWLDPNANVIQSTSLPIAQEPEKEAANPSGNGIPLPLTVSPGQASKLIEDVGKIQDLMDQRNQVLEDAISGARKSAD